MDAHAQRINDIFNGNRILEIPYFQRAYVWKEPQWERLLEDMENISQHPRPYFMGSVILKQKLISQASKVGDVRTVIDGQQRLTTLNIFFKVLGLKTGDIYLSKELFRIHFPSQNGVKELALHHSHNDIVMFNRIMNMEVLEDLSKNEDLISKAYSYFVNNINTDKLNHYAILNNILFIGIDVAVDEDEQQIFDTINSLGVKLNTAELLKNYFFNRDFDSYCTYWKEVFEKDDDTKKYWDTIITTGRFTRSFIDIFFYAYLQIKIQEPQANGNVTTLDKIEFSRVETLFESYKKFIRNYGVDKQQMLQEIKEYATIFARNFDPSVLENELTEEAGIDRINALIFGLDNSTLIPYVLYVLHEQKDGKELEKLFCYIETFIVRRIIVRANNKNYNQLFTDRCILNKIVTKEQFQEYIENQTEDDTVNKMPSDKELEYAFANQVYVNKTAASILYFIETKIRDKVKYSTQLLGLNKYSLEHMMPKKWRNHWDKPETKEEQDRRDKLLLTMGNLTIITQNLNAAIRDAEWSIKLNGKGYKGGLRRYGTGIQIAADALSKDVWNEESIEERGKYLFELVTMIYRV